jgi:hypothetical protein
LEEYNGNEYVVLRNRTGITGLFLVDDGGDLVLVDDDQTPEELLKEVYRDR